jgi:hypothetical protein
MNVLLFACLIERILAPPHPRPTTNLMIAYLLTAPHNIHANSIPLPDGNKPVNDPNEPFGPFDDSLGEKEVLRESRTSGQWLTGQK